MAYFAHIENWITPTLGVIDNILVIDHELIMSGGWGSPEDWIETGEAVIATRINHAFIGGLYDKTHDVFYAQRPFPSWSLNQITWLWEAPIPMPTDGKMYKWDEDTVSWIEVVP